MAQVEKVGVRDFERVHAELLTLLDPDRPKEEWQRIFNYRWRREDDPCGYVLVDQGELVGFLGLVFSQPTIDGETRSLCNVTSWIVKDSHRAEGAMLIFPLRRLKDRTVTNLSCTPEVHRVFTRLGFDTLESHRRVFLPPAPRRSRCECEIIYDPGTIADHLDAPDRQRLEDHLPYTEHLLILDGDGYCHVMFTRGRRWMLPVARIHWFSDRDRFVRHLAPLQRSLRKRRGLMLAECDERLLKGIGAPRSLRRELPTPRLFKSPDLTAEQVPNIYSEIVLLDLV